ncbi:MAG: PH domain-containing protein [Bryobacteraceae bacterium]
MPDIVIRPTTKFLRAGAIAASFVFLGLEIAYLALWASQYPRHWVMAFPALVLLWPAARWLRRQATRTVVTGDRLRYETGLAAKSTRTIQLSKFQDVRVEQRLMQRVFNVGDLSIETAGEASRLTLANVDDPHKLADEIMNRAQAGQSSGPV